MKMLAATAPTTVETVAATPVLEAPTEDVPTEVAEATQPPPIALVAEESVPVETVITAEPVLKKTKTKAKAAIKKKATRRKTTRKTTKKKTTEATA